MEFELPEVEEVSDYEEQCSLTRARNKTFLESLNLDAPAFVPKIAKKPRAPRKRKVSALHSPEPQRQSKVARVESSEDGSANTGLRRSGRNQGKKVDYASDNIGHAMPRLASVQAGLREMVTEPRSLNKRMHDPSVPQSPVYSPLFFMTLPFYQENLRHNPRGSCRVMVAYSVSALSHIGD